MFGQNIRYQYAFKITLDDKYLQEVDPQYPILAYTSSVGEIGIIKESFYRSGNNGAFQALFSKQHKFTYKELQFVLSAIKIHFDTFGYGTGMANVIDLEIQLPITPDGTIDYDFMERFVRELEEERVRELAAYLSASGLSDYRLTAEETSALQRMDNVTWGEFNVIDIFNVKNTGNILSREISPNSGTTPYLCASKENNAISSYVSFDEERIDKGNCIFIGGKTFVVTYQEQDFYSNDSHNLILSLKDETKKNRNSHLFMVSCVDKGLGYKYSWGDSISKTKIQTDKFRLPLAPDGTIDYAFMETFIRAIHKQVIAGVVEYAERKMQTYHTVVDR